LCFKDSKSGLSPQTAVAAQLDEGDKRPAAITATARTRTAHVQLV